MENFIKIGITEGFFTGRHVLDLIYGGVEVEQHYRTDIRQLDNCYLWNPGERDWGKIPLEERKEIISFIIQTDLKKERFTEFHKRILCLLHGLLDDEENIISWDDDMICNMTHEPDLDYIGRKYCASFKSNQQRSNAFFEMFYWWHCGVSKTKEEYRLLNECWKKILGTIPARARKRAVQQIQNKIVEIEAKYQKISRSIAANRALMKKYTKEIQKIESQHISARRKELLLELVDDKRGVTKDRINKGWRAEVECRIALSFLRGYLCYIDKVIKKIPSA